MASIIKSDNGVSSGITGIVQSADSSGQLVLQTTTSSGTATTAVTIDNTQVATFANTLKAPNLQGPTFSAYQPSNQSLTSATYTNITCSTKEFDTGGCFNNTGTTATLNGLSVPAYAFCPNVAGYYQFNAALDSSGSAVVTAIALQFYKNGSNFKSGPVTTVGSSTPRIEASTLIYLNGSGDYVQFYGYIAGTAPATGGSQTQTWFQASMVRSA